MADALSGLIRTGQKAAHGFAMMGSPGYRAGQLAQANIKSQAQQRQLINDIQRIQAAGGINTEAGRQILAQLSGKYSPDMFISPYEQARTKYWSEGRTRTGPASDLYSELEYWNKQLRNVADPGNIAGVRTDPKTGEVKGILNQDLYDTAQKNISRILREISQLGEERVSQRPGAKAVPSRVLPTGQTPDLFGELMTGEQVPPEYRRLGVKSYRPPAGVSAGERTRPGGWGGGLALPAPERAAPSISALAEQADEEWLKPEVAEASIPTKKPRRRTTEELTFAEIAPIIEKAEKNGIKRLDLYIEAGKLRKTIWSQLTREERLTAYEAIAQGKTGEQIIEYFKSQTKQKMWETP